MQPFCGVQVLDLTHVYAGPFCTYQLGVLGAEVIKIEPVTRPDMTRQEGEDAALNAKGMGLSYQAQGAGKRCLALNLKSAEGRAIFEQLLDTADVLVLNYTKRATEALGLDYDSLSRLKPALIYCAISGFGQSGPKGADPAYDNVIQAFSGIMATNGTAQTGPLRIGPAVVDYGTGIQAAFAIAAALYGRAMTGQGRRIDVAMADCALMLMNAYTAAMLAGGKPPELNGNSDPRLAGYGCYETGDGQHLMIGAFTNAQCAALMRVLGHPGAAEEIEQTPRAKMPARALADAAVIAACLRKKSAQEWEQIFNAAHIPAARVRAPIYALEAAQFAARGSVHAVGDQRLVPAGFHYDHGGPAIDRPPPAHGADSRAILAELGIDRARYDALARSGVVRGADSDPG